MTDTESEAVAWTPCIDSRGEWRCDGENHKGWEGHDPWYAMCPRPDPNLMAARKILGDMCACYAEAWPSGTCDAESRKLRALLSTLFPASSLASRDTRIAELEALLEEAVKALGPFAAVDMTLARHDPDDALRVVHNLQVGHFRFARATLSTITKDQDQ